MLRIGENNNLVITKIGKEGVTLDGGGRDILLSRRELPRNAGVGDWVDVFIYNDSKESLKATTLKPAAQVGDFAPLKVINGTDFGVFFDWGLPKDLFVPNKYLHESLRPGDKAVVYLMLDYEKTGVIGTCKLDAYFQKDTSALGEGQEVSLLVFDFSPLGVNVVIDNRYRGLLYDNEVYEDLDLGDRRRGYIKKLREDGRIDVTLQPQNFPDAAKIARDAILKALGESGGYLPLHDKSDPEVIKNRLHMSKKVFKKAVGGLYKDGVILIEEGGIRLQTE